MAIKMLKKGRLDKELYVRKLGHWIGGIILIGAALIAIMYGTSLPELLSYAAYIIGLVLLIFGILTMISATGSRMEEYYKDHNKICTLTRNSFCGSNCTQCVFAAAYLSQEFSSADSEDLIEAIEDLTEDSEDNIE